jgi:hypothetical protein
MSVQHHILDKMPEQNSRDKMHLFLPSGEAKDFSAYGGSASSKLPSVDREAHARKLEGQLQSAILAYENQIKITPELAERGGFYLEFKLDKASAKHALGSLENRQGKTHIELRSVTEEAGSVSAIVFVPYAKKDYFLKQVEEYRTQATGKNSPKHQKLITPIESVMPLVSVSKIFTDSDALPPPDQKVWWEAWLEKNSEVEFREMAERLELRMSQGQLSFVEREVVLIHATVGELEKLMQRSSRLAELRLVRETASTFMQMESREQRDFVEDLLGRLQISNPNNVFICILDSGIMQRHPLIEPHLQISNCYSNDGTPPGIDVDGHGTKMAGLAIYGDLFNVLMDAAPVKINHALESSKIFPNSETHERFWARLTQDAISYAEIGNPEARRVICLAISEKNDVDNPSEFSRRHDLGDPSLWSAQLDKLAFGVEQEPNSQRLIIVAGGNTPRPETASDYPDRNDVLGIESPGQSWNALTIGAYTEKTTIIDTTFKGHRPLANVGELSPASRTSVSWKDSAPIKPDVVFEGGNYSVQPGGTIDAPDDLALLTTRKDFGIFTTFADTSAATALAAQMAAKIMHEYPTLNPETLRALMVHSAQWTPEMLSQIEASSVQEKRKNHLKLRRYGYGVPNLELAIRGSTSDFTLIIEDELQPFHKIDNDVKNFQMKLHNLPWKAILEPLGEATAELKVTLSFFIEPNPGRRGGIPRFLYASHGLRFDVKRKEDSLTSFLGRINAQSEPVDGVRRTWDNDGWDLGTELRKHGGIHSDVWKGTAAELASRDAVAVYPVTGWWRARTSHKRYNQKARYSLLISLKVATEVDIYSRIKSVIETPIENPTAILIPTK